MLFVPFLFPLCPQLVSLMIVSHRAAQHFFAARAQRLQWSLTAAPSKVGISISSPLKFIHLSASLLWAPLQCLQAGWCSAQTSEQCKQSYLSSTGWLFFFFFSGWLLAVWFELPALLLKHYLIHCETLSPQCVFMTVFLSQKQPQAIHLSKQS